MPGFTERERTALTKTLKEIGDEAEAQRDGRTILPFTKGVRRVLVHSLFAVADAAVEAAKVHAKELDDVRAQRMKWLEDRVRELERKVN